MEDLKKYLEEYYGYKEFRKGQENIIKEIMEARDVLAIMPTGAGKSICYQLPALILKGLTIVISPLISLMKDQVDSLKALNIKADYINSSLDKYALEEVIYGIKNNEFKIVYIAPERLESKEFIDAIRGVEISQVAVDEAHCVSQWGHDFRSSYRNIAAFIKSIESKPVVTAFTATASEEVREDIIKLLNLHSPRVFVNGFDRENLEIIIEKGVEKEKYILEYIQKNIELSGIIYCATRKEVENIFNKLLKKSLQVSKYHAGLSDDERKSNQEDFINDKKNIMVATNAFGMGIDKPNIRYVIHNNMPQSLENYYQEIGRAGRDGEKSQCILLFSPGDIQLQKYLIDQGIKMDIRKNIAYKKLQDMSYLIYSNHCYRKYILNYFEEEALENCNNCSNCLFTGEEVDRTIDAQKVLSCIYRMGRPFGVNMIVDVLRGSKNSKIISFGFNELTTYGIMKGISKIELTTFINTLISHGYVNQVEGVYPTLKLNSKSAEILKGKSNVILKEVVVKENKYKVNDLFRNLRELRKDIASKEGVPPYVIFGDVTLKEMSVKYPKTEEELLALTGVGKVKFQRYGQGFLDRINKYIVDNEIVIKGEEEVEEDLNSEFLLVESDNELYCKLRILREEFSKKEKKIGYSIIAQNTLKEISGRYPQNLEELADISGFGPKKIERYGEEILLVVKDYLNENSKRIVFEKKNKRKLIIDGEKRDNYEITIDMIEDGLNIEEISNNIEVSISTLLGYITDYIRETGDISFNLNLGKYYKKENEDIILNICKKVGIDKIGDIKKEAPKDVKYEEIRAVILKNYYNIA